MGGETRRAKSLRIGVHHAIGVVWEPVYRTHLYPWIPLASNAGRYAPYPTRSNHAPTSDGSHAATSRTLTICAAAAALARSRLEMFVRIICQNSSNETRPSPLESAC